MSARLCLGATSASGMYAGSKAITVMDFKGYEWIEKCSEELYDYIGQYSSLAETIDYIHLKTKEMIILFNIA